MKAYVLTFFLLAIISTGFAEEISGDWYGKLDIKGTKLSLVFHFSKKGDGYTATLDSPDQHAFGIQVDQMSYKTHALLLAVTSLGLRYQATFHPDSSRIQGTFYQGTLVLPLMLSKKMPVSTGKIEPPKPRPQDPQSFPYKREEVKFVNKKAGCTLAGTLTLPNDAKPKSIVVLITGSGPQNRDEELVGLNHRPFLVWSDWLTRQGICVLRYDDRGVSHSTGNFATATTGDFAEDAAAAVAYLKSRKDLAGIPIGLLGHSEGGMIAPIVAASNPSISYIVLLAGPGVSIRQLMLRQIFDQSRLAGIAPYLISREQKINEELYNFVIANKSLTQEELKTRLMQVSKEQLTNFPQDTLNSSSIKTTLEQTISMVSSPWFRYFIACNPRVALGKLRCPVLALNGTLDFQVSCNENLNAIRETFAMAGNRKAEVKKLEGMNHLFQKAKTGTVIEYSQIDETVDPSVLSLVSGWIQKQ